MISTALGRSCLLLTLLTGVSSFLSFFMDDLRGLSDFLEARGFEGLSGFAVLPSGFFRANAGAVMTGF
jgi:hypothetical protein